jgi:AcrR family transcriptional regulator
MTATDRNADRNDRSDRNTDRTAETRDRILAAACATIADIGFEKLRMKMVAERAGVSTALLHYHFETREKLFAEAFRDSFEHTGESWYAAIDADVSAAQRLASIIDACLPLDDELRQDFLLWQELWLRAARDEPSRLLALDFYRQMHVWFSDAVRAGVASGEFRRCDVEEVTGLALTLVDGFGIRLVLGDPAYSPERARTRIWALLSPELGLPAEMPTRARSSHPTPEGSP